MNQDKHLNREQIAAINHGVGPLLIIAGAGTGKTTVVTERIKHLINSGDAKPSEILGLTFTEKASREMEERVDIAMPYGYTQMWISTFHSFCDRILRDEALHIGLDPRFRLMTESETIQLLRKNLFSFKMEYFRPLGNPNKFLDAILTHFSRLQDENITPSDYLSWVKKKSKLAQNKDEKLEVAKWRELAEAYRTYEELKVKEGVMDYGDLIVKTLHIFISRPNILAKYQQQFKYILVDEYQDTNFAQNELVEILASKSGNLTVVADDDQSIYRFRGAAISNILQFRANFPDAKTIVLTKNYRSYQEVLDKAYALIQHNNPDRLEVVENVNKKLRSQRKSHSNKKLVEFIHVSRVEEEAESVCREIEKLVVQDKKYNFKDIAILVRANNHAEPFLRTFQRRGMPHQFLGPGRLFRQPEIIDLISYLKVLKNFEDTASFYRVLSYSYFEIPTMDLIKLGNYAKRNYLTLFEATKSMDKVNIADSTREQITKLVTYIEKQIPLTKKTVAGQLLYDFLQDFDLLPKLLNPQDVQAQKIANNISRFFDRIKTYETTHMDSTIDELVDWVDLSTELGESPLANDSDWANVNAVNILTVHSSKGLEFPVVFLVNLVSERFPSRDRRESLPIPDELIREVLPAGDFHLQEERRLFYVGMTRACDLLYLTAADYYGEGKRGKKLSQFIFEALGENVLASEATTEVQGKQLSLLDYALPKVSAPVAEPNEFHIDYLSYSQIDTFRSCPLHYKLRYILGLPGVPSSALSFGSSIHAALKDFYLSAKAGKVSQNLLIELLKKNWVIEGYSDKEHEKQAFTKAKNYLTVFYKKHFDAKSLPLVVEQPFIVDLKPKGVRPLKIGGKIDRVDQLSGGKIEIVDYKTGSNIPTQRDVDKNLQLTFYALAATEVEEFPFGKSADDVILSLYFFEKDLKISTKRTTAELLKAKEEVLDIRNQIEKSDFKCSRGIWCDNCEFALFCGSD